MTTPTAYAWCHDHQRPPAVGVGGNFFPVSIARMYPETWDARVKANPDFPISMQALHIAGQLAALPPHAERWLLIDHLGTVALGGDPARIMRDGVADRDGERVYLRWLGDELQRLRCRIDVLATDMEITVGENRLGATPSAVAPAWCPEMWPFTPADYHSTVPKLRLACRDRFESIARGIACDHIRWALETSGYIDCPAGSILWVSGHGGKGRIDPRTGEPVVVTESINNPLPIPAFRPGTIDAPYCYARTPAEVAFVLDRAKLIRDTAPRGSRLVPVIPLPGDTQHTTPEAWTATVRGLYAIGARTYFVWCFPPNMAALDMQGQYRLVSDEMQRLEEAA